MFLSNGRKGVDRIVEVAHILHRIVDRNFNSPRGVVRLTRPSSTDASGLIRQLLLFGFRGEDEYHDAYQKQQTQ